MRIQMLIAALLLGAGGAAAAQTPPANPAEVPLAVGSSVGGVLGFRDRQRGSGKIEDVYVLSGRRGDRVELSLSSSEFDSYLLVTGPGGFQIGNDDDPAGRAGSLDSRLVLELPEDGAYRISATSFRPGATGGYRLSAAVPRGGAAVSRPDPAQAVAVGSTAAGTLGGRSVDRYRFSGRRGQRVAIELASNDFDTVLVVRQPDGEEIDNDDSGPRARPSTNSRIETALPEDGDYLILVSSYRPDRGGKYRLSLRPSQGSARQIAVQGGRRVFALSVGVSDYGGRTSALANTDLDAERAAAALDKAGLLNPASIVLTNAQATRGAVAAAVERIAAQAGPDDLFLFFYSGHGDQVPAAAGSAELDGLRETLELRDAAMTDAELARLLSRVRAGRVLILIDSCFSGGFRELVDRPGVMAIFSSEEDLTSDVAGALGSGGYLAHSLPEALTGAGALDGDLMVTAGEIGTYVRRQFVRQGEIGAVTSDRLQRNLQQIVVERGAVQVDDVVLRLGAPPAQTAAR